MSSSCTEIEEMVFPEEILMKIWSYLDFETVQKTCKYPCFEILVRNDTMLKTVMENETTRYKTRYACCYGFQCHIISVAGFKGTSYFI